MIAVIQRVSRASVTVEDAVTGACGEGLLILLGVAKGDTQADAEKLAAKISKLRIFCDEQGKMNRSVNDVGGSVLVVSQFTLLANCVHGNRPDFFGAAEPNTANELYEYFASLMEKLVPGGVGRGVFGADMKVELCNDGPVTILMDSSELKPLPKGSEVAL